MLPALLIDVDGPVNPYGAKPTRRPDGYRTFRYPVDDDRRSLRVWLNPGHGSEFLNLADRFQLMWASSWKSAAADWVGPRIGLPADLPFVEFSGNPPRPVPELDMGRGIYWKTETIAQAMKGRFFVWIDDDVSRADVEYLELRHGPRFVIYRVDPAVGLLGEDFERIAAITVSSQRWMTGPTAAELTKRRRSTRIHRVSAGDG